MPGFPGFDPLDPTANLIRQTGVSVKMVSLAGDTYSARLSGLGSQDLAFGEKTRLAEALGAASNMGVYSLTEDRDSFIRITDAEAIDDAYASPANVLVMTFENNEGRKISGEVPAPDATLFESDGVSLKPRTDATVGAIIGELIDAHENVINTSFLPLNSYAFVRGVRRQRKYKLPSGQREKPSDANISEGSGATAGPAT